MSQYDVYSFDLSWNAFGECEFIDATDDRAAKDKLSSMFDLSPHLVRIQLWERDRFVSMRERG